MSSQIVPDPMTSDDVEHVEEPAEKSDAAMLLPGLVHRLRHRWSSGLDWLARHARRHTVTVSVEGEQVRMVVLRGKRVVHWVTISLGTVQGDEPAEQEGKAAHLVRLVRGLGLKRVRVVSDLPLQLPMVTLLHLPDVERRYLDQVVATEALEAIPFSSEEVDVVWQGQKEGDGITVAATVLPRSGVDERVAWLRGQGLRPRAAYAQATALALAAVESDVLTLHLGRSQAITALVQGWVPQVQHQIQLTAYGKSPRDLALPVARALEQVASFGSTGAGDEESTPLPVMVTGDVHRWAGLLAEIAQVVERPMLTGVPSVAYPPDFPLGEYGINVGLALADRVKGGERKILSRARPFALNLLPQRHLPQPLPVRSAAPVAILLLLGSTAFNVAPIVQSAEAEVAVLSPRVERLERQGRQQRLQLAKARRITQTLQTSTMQGQQVSDFASGREQDIALLRRRVAVLAEDALPSTGRLRQLSSERGELTVTGVAASYEEVFRYVADLKASGLFEAVRLPRVVATTRGAQGAASVEFQVVAKATSPQEGS